MNVSSPRSTKGRNASCCALLKRCTSSTKRIVCRPDCASVASARATASRMSLTPARTAEMAMKSALNASAINRASEVFPDPGGPQRIIECGLPDANATASGLPGPNRWRWPTTSSTVFGRSRSASGVAGLATANRSVADDIGALGRGELEQLGRELRVALEMREPDRRTLPKVVEDLQRGQAGGIEAEADVAEARFLVFRGGAQPVEAVCCRQIVPIESPFHVVLAGEQCRRRRAQRLVVATLNDLVQIRVVNPHPLAVADQQLLVRLVDVPAELTGSSNREFAARLLRDTPVLIGDRLREACARRLRIAHERAQSFERRGLHQRGLQAEQRNENHGYREQGKPSQERCEQPRVREGPQRAPRQYRRSTARGERGPDKAIGAHSSS